MNFEKRTWLVIFTPPVAVCRYGCASCCVAPISVFWLASIVSVIYAFFGGPLASAGAATEFSWGTFALGAVLWAIASIWAENVVKGVQSDMDDPKCEGKSSSFCRMVTTNGEETDPMDEIKNLK